MRQPENVKPFLEALLDKKIGSIVTIDKQKDLKDGLDLHGVRLDITLEDDAESQYTIEMQVGTARDLEERIRYYQSSLDRRTLEVSENYRDLRESYVIFVCTDDYFKRGLAIYKRKSVIEGAEDIVYDDRSHAYILNASFTEGNGDEAVLDFLRYIDAGYRKKPFDVSHSEYLTKIEHAVESVKTDEGRVASYMTLAMKLQDERWLGREEGLQKGLKEGQEMGRRERDLKIVKRMVSRGLPLEEISDMIGLSLAEVKELAEQE